MIKEGDWVLLYLNDRVRFVVKASSQLKFHTHKGFIVGGDIVGKDYGETVRTSGGVDFVILKPSIRDFIRKFSRASQIIYPKDAAIIIAYLGIGPGSTVLEGGVGSGALTAALAHAVGDRGKVIGYDVREEAVETAKKNLEMLGLTNFELRLGDVTSYSGEPADAIMLDVPSPWDMVSWVKSFLKPSSACACLCPTYNQVEKTVIALRDTGFVDVQALEILERKIRVAQNATRPENLGLSHTAFLVFARSTRLSFGFEGLGHRNGDHKTHDESSESPNYDEEGGEGLIAAEPQGQLPSQDYAGKN
ncbi:MAG: tRNA (adenine-N1)-methyltransferase [Thermoprotei archaeon]